MTKRRKRRAKQGAADAIDDGVMRIAPLGDDVSKGIEGGKGAGDQMSRVVAVIVALATAFIAFVAWLIHSGQ